jgi:hypothetical protein
LQADRASPALLRFLEEQNMKSLDIYRNARAGLAIFLSSLAVAVIAFLVVMATLMAFG